MSDRIYFSNSYAPWSWFRLGGSDSKRGNKSVQPDALREALGRDRRQPATVPRAQSRRCWWDGGLSTPAGVSAQLRGASSFPVSCSSLQDGALTHLPLWAQLRPKMDKRRPLCPLLNSGAVTGRGGLDGEGPEEMAGCVV